MLSLPAVQSTRNVKSPVFYFKMTKSSLRLEIVASLIMLLCLSCTNPQDFSSISCDSLSAPGTSLLCTLPSNQGTTDCTQPSVPGTVASYSCRDVSGNILQGFLRCQNSGIWISSFKSGRNSLCRLQADIINVQVPDVAVATNQPEFTTPVPNSDLLQGDLSGLEDYHKVALQLHNTFRRNHGVPFVSIAPLMNRAAQDLVNFIAFGSSSTPPDPTKRLNLLNLTLNIESNWYMQEPQAPNFIEAASNAIQSWYATGFQTYNWVNVASNLDNSGSLAFSRIIWKNTKFIGIGVANFNGVTFVACIYTPGRDVSSVDPASQLSMNVLPVRVG